MTGLKSSQIAIPEILNYGKLVVLVKLGGVPIDYSGAKFLVMLEFQEMFSREGDTCPCHIFASFCEESGMLSDNHGTIKEPGPDYYYHPMMSVCLVLVLLLEGSIILNPKEPSLQIWRWSLLRWVPLRFLQPFDFQRQRCVLRVPMIYVQS